MKKIKELIGHLDEELEGAKEYAEKYVDSKVMDDMSKANKYKQMANDELNHAMYIHGFIVDEIKSMEGKVEPPVEMMEKWEKEHKEYIEEMAFIKQILAM